MKYWKGYGRYLRSKNPKMPIRSEEFEPIRDDFVGYWAEIEGEMRTEESEVLGIAGPKPGLGMLVFIVASQVLVIVLSIITATITFSPITFGGAIVILLLTVWGIFYQVGRHLRSKEKGTDNIDDAIVMARRYYTFHRPMVLEANNYDEYLQYVRMSNVTDFQAVLVPDHS